MYVIDSSPSLRLSWCWIRERILLLTSLGSLVLLSSSVFMWFLLSGGASNPAFRVYDGYVGSAQEDAGKPDASPHAAPLRALSDLVLSAIGIDSAIKEP